jgi:hypothetical protein
MVDSRAKGARTETQIRDVLRLHTDLQWERVPGSGSLDPKHKLKGDLYVPDRANIFCVEVKGYADDHLTSQVLTSKSPQLVDFWQQSVRQGKQIDRKPLLIFKFNRSKAFVAFEELPSVDTYRYIYINIEPYRFFVATLEDWLSNEQIKFVA